MAGTRTPGLLLRRCAGDNGLGVRCTNEAHSLIVVSRPGSLFPDVTTFWCLSHLNALNLQAASALLAQSATVSLRSA